MQTLLKDTTIFEPKNSMLQSKVSSLSINGVTDSSSALFASSKYDTMKNKNAINPIATNVNRPQPFETLNIIGSASILGGTAFVYSSILKHSSCTLNPIATFYMFLLAIQYCIQPRITKKYLDKRVNKKSVAMVEEVVKMSIAAGIFGSSAISKVREISGKGFFENIIYDGFSSITTTMQEILKDWTLTSSLTVAALPAFLYAIQGVLTYTAYQNLDPVTFNGLSQTKIISSALCCFWILGKRQSLVQVGALSLLFSSSLIFQGGFKNIKKFRKVWYNKTNRNKSQNYEIMKQTDAVGDSATAISKNAEYRQFVLGILPCLCATFLSGLAGALSQKGLQITGLEGKGRDPYLYTVEVSFFSALCLFFSTMFQNWKKLVLNVNDKHEMNQHTDSNKNGYFAYWSAHTFIPIAVKAIGGLLTALVHKYAGSVMKGFALILGLVFSGVIQTILDGENLRLDQLVGTILVMVSTWLHFTNPPL